VEAFAASNLRLSELEIPAEAGLLSFSMTTALLFYDLVSVFPSVAAFNTGSIEMPL
jgi:hypothetical protein